MTAKKLVVTLILCGVLSCGTNAYAGNDETFNRNSTKAVKAQSSSSSESSSFTGFNLKTLKFWERPATKNAKKKANVPALTIVNEPYVPYTPQDIPQAPNNVNNSRAAIDLAPMPPVVSNPSINSGDILPMPEPIEAEVKQQKPSSLNIADDVPVFTPKAQNKPPEKITETWRARKGESLHDVLSRWSDRAGVAMTWSSVKSPKLPRDVSYVGTYEDAVERVLSIAGIDGVKPEWNKENSINNDTAPIDLTKNQMKNLDGADRAGRIDHAMPTPLVVDDLPPPRAPQKSMTVSEADKISDKIIDTKTKTVTIGNEPPVAPLTPLLPEAATILTESDPVPLVPVTDATPVPQGRVRFYALAGTSLEQALRSWAGSQEFELVWNADRDFKIKRTISNNDSAEDALQEILSSYEGDKTRPVGKLFRDRKTAKPVLVISTDR